MVEGPISVLDCRCRSYGPVLNSEKSPKSVNFWPGAPPQGALPGPGGNVPFRQAKTRTLIFLLAGFASLSFSVEGSNGELFDGAVPGLSVTPLLQTSECSAPPPGLIQQVFVAR